MNSDEKPRARFYNRLHAGHELAADLPRYLGGQEPVILAIPRGGVPVGAAIAGVLSAPLDLIVPRRIEAPGQPGVTLGAIAPDRTLVVNREATSGLGLSDEQLDELAVPVWLESQRVQRLYRQNRPYPDLKGRIAIIVDDRLLTGYSMMAAVASVRKLEPARIMVAVPVSYVDGIERVRSYVDDLLSLEITTDPEYMASRYYADWAPLADNDVIWTLEHAWEEHPAQGYSETF
jgi:putative phosphoribosyl transferase